MSYDDGDVELCVCTGLAVSSVFLNKNSVSPDPRFPEGHEA